MFVYLEGFIFYASQGREEALKECSYLRFFGIGFRFCLISDFSISGWSGFPDFRISGFPYFRVSWFPVYVSIVEPVGWKV